MKRQTAACDTDLLCCNQDENFPTNMQQQILVSERKYPFLLWELQIYTYFGFCHSPVDIRALACAAVSGSERE